MSRHCTQFEASGGGLVLTNAILLYRSRSPGGGHSAGAQRGEAAAFASIHAVEQDGDQPPTIAAGKPLTRAQLRHWTKALGRTAGPEILPGNVLVAHADLLAWWVPEQVRAGYFALSSPPAGVRTLAGRVTAPVPYPAHLFVATRHGLGVYALAASERPAADTALLHSPILNVFVDGQLCWGDIVRPPAPTVALIPDYERAVFDSWSTHPNPGQEGTITGTGGLQALWDDLATRRAKRFPVKRLKPFGGAHRGQRRPSGSAPAAAITLGELIAVKGRS